MILVHYLGNLGISDAEGNIRKYERNVFFVYVLCGYDKRTLERYGKVEIEKLKFISMDDIRSEYKDWIGKGDFVNWFRESSEIERWIQKKFYILLLDENNQKISVALKSSHKEKETIQLSQGDYVSNFTILNKTFEPL